LVQFKYNEKSINQFRYLLKEEYSFLFEKFDLDIMDSILSTTSDFNHVLDKEYSLPSLSVIFKFQIVALLFVYGLYAVGHFGIEANIEDSKTVRSIADFPK